MVAALGLGAAAAAGFGCMARASNERMRAEAGSRQARNSSKVAANRHTAKTLHECKERCILHPSQAEIDELPKENAMGMSGR